MHMRYNVQKVECIQKLLPLAKYDGTPGESQSNHCCQAVYSLGMDANVSDTPMFPAMHAGTPTASQSRVRLRGVHPHGLQATAVVRPMPHPMHAVEILGSHFTDRCPSLIGCWPATSSPWKCMHKIHNQTRTSTFKVVSNHYKHTIET